MAVQEDILPIPKMVLSLVLFAAGTVIFVFTGQAFYLTVQDMENTAKLIDEPAGMENVVLDQKAKLTEYRLVDQDKKRLSIPIETAKKIVAKELGQGAN